MNEVKDLILKWGGYYLSSWHAPANFSWFRNRDAWLNLKPLPLPKKIIVIGCERLKTIESKVPWQKRN